MNVEEIPGKLREGLDALRLGISDLRTQLLARRVLIELRDDGLRGVVLGPKGLTLELPLPQGACRDGVPLEREAIGDLIGDQFLELGLAGARVGVCLPTLASSWKVVRWPHARMPENGRAELRLRAADLGMPWPLAEIYLEVEPLPGEPPRSLVVAAPQAVVDGWAEVFELAGLQLQRLLTPQLCEWSLLTGREADLETGLEQWLLNLEAGRSRLWVVSEGVPVADWELPAQHPDRAQPPDRGLDPALLAELERCRRFWEQHSSRGVPAPQQWFLYGDDRIVASAEAGLRRMLPEGSLQRWRPAAADATLGLRLSGLKLCMGWT
ncbi:MAG: hypothetical protein VKK98_05040 [Cyanobacteriota bacterium]|nr:hypothetical protein [Cyanobacteriota bacterium]